jgi:hypothetical protein
MVINALRFGNFVLLIVNISLFGLWFSLIRKDSLPPGGDATGYLLSQLSVQVTVLGLTVAVGAFIIAGLGVFGFQVMVERAQAKAEEIAKETIAIRFRELEGDRDRTIRTSNLTVQNPETGAREARD